MLLTRSPLSPRRFYPKIKFPEFVARLACVRHAASVHPEPGSNPQRNFMRSEYLQLFKEHYLFLQGVLYLLKYTLSRVLLRLTPTTKTSFPGLLLLSRWCWSFCPWRWWRRWRRTWHFRSWRSNWCWWFLRHRLLDNEEKRHQDNYYQNHHSCRIALLSLCHFHPSCLFLFSKLD